MKKRVVAFLMSVCVAVSSVPMDARAAAETVDREEISEVTEEQVQEEIPEEHAVQKENEEELDIANESVSSGTCGENLTWELDNAGTLTISGTGDMTNYAQNVYAPWYNFNGNSPVRAIVILEGVTSIGDYAFLNCYNALSVEIPSGVKSIGMYAFSNCKKVTSLKIPDTVTSIGRYAFDRCSGFIEMTLSNSITNIEEATFKSCSSLMDIIIPDGVTNIERWAFESCEGLKSITIPDSVAYIEGGIFSGCKNLEKAVIGAGIPAEASEALRDMFLGCNNLKNIDVSDENMNYASVKGILYDKEKAKLISVPKGMSEVIIHEEVKELGDYSFQWCDKLTEVVLPDSVLKVGKNVFSNCTQLTRITFSQNMEDIGESMFKYCKSLSDIDIPNSVKVIGKEAFYGCEALQEIVIPDSVVTVGEYAFKECISLEKVELGSGVERIGREAFSECVLLEELVLSEGIKQLGIRMLAGTSVNSIIIPKSVTTADSEYYFMAAKQYCRGPLSGATNLRTVIFEEGTTAIPGYICISTSVTSVTIPDGVLSIGSNAFCDAELEHIVIPGSVNKVGYAAFYGNPLYSAGPIGGGYDYEYGWTTTIPDNAFGNENLKKIVIPEEISMIAGSPFEGSGIESAGPLGSGADCEFGWKDIIPAQTFLGCENLTEVTLPDTIEEIGRAVFDHCVKLEKIDLPEKLLKMGDSAFSRCESLLTIEIPETIEKIVEGTFFECKKLEKIAFSNKVTEIRENAFKDCVVLKDVYYAGTEEEWNAISINSEGNSALTNATIHFNSKFSAEDSDFNEYLYRADILSNPESPSYKGMAAYRSMPTPCDMYNIAIQGQPTLTGVMKAWRLTTGYVDLVDDPSTVLELAVEKKDMYLALLMAVLEKAGEDNKFFAAVKDSAEISKTVTTYAEQTWNIELTEANLLKDLTKEQKEELIAQISTEKEELGYLSKAVEGVEDIATFVKELDEAGRLLGMSEAMKSLVSEMHLNCPSDNADLLLALGECSKIMDATYEDLVTGKLGVSLGKKGVEITADIYWKYTKDYFFDMCPGASMLLSCYKIGKTVTNAVFKTDKTIESFYKVMAMADIENLMSVTYEDILAAYRNDRTIDNAQLLIEAMNTYFQMWNTDCVQVEKTLDVLSSVPVSSSNFDGTREQLAVIQKNYEQEHISVLKDWIFDLEEDYPNIYPKYSGLLDEFEIDKVVKALDIACPVDVLVYDSGNNLVASVINERAWANDEVTLSVMGDEKILYLYDGADYRIQTTGYDVGTMNITVMEYEDGDMIREVSYENVPVSPDLTYEMNVNDLTLEDAAYVLENVTDGKTVEHDLDTYEDRKKASVAITVKNGAMMVNNVPVTEAQLVPGERIDIVAFKSEISKFIEWQSDKNNVKFADAKSSATTFTVPDEAAAIKAVFEEDANNDISLASVSAISDQKYTGRELKPSVTVTLDGAVLVSGVDYSVAYKNNIKPGTASVTITGKGNYTGSVTKTFKIVGDPSWLYDDVPETSGWRYEAIKYVTDHGIMNGISGTRNFDPDGMLTREMFATIIYRVEGSPAAAYNGRFPDVKDPNYYVKPIAWASANGIINGHSNTGLFGVLENITREDLVVIMYRYAKTKGYNTGGGVSLSRFPDAGDTSGYAVEAMKWAVGNGIVNGRSNTGMLDPKGNAARVEAAAIIQRFMTKIK